MTGRPDGKSARGFARDGVVIVPNAPGGLNRRHRLQVDAQGFLNVVERGNNRVQKFSPNGTPIGWIGWIGGKADGSLTDGWENVSTLAATTLPGGFNAPVS